METLQYEAELCGPVKGTRMRRWAVVARGYARDKPKYYEQSHYVVENKGPDF